MNHITKQQRLEMTRRHFFGQAAGFGIGSAALATSLSEGLSAQSVPHHILDFAPKVKSVIYLQQAGGPPRGRVRFQAGVGETGRRTDARELDPGRQLCVHKGTPNLQKSPFPLRQCGKSGVMLSVFYRTWLTTSRL